MTRFPPTPILLAAGCLAGCHSVSPKETGPARIGSRQLETGAEWDLVWQDEFDGERIDPARWNHVVGGGGYGNNESQCYTDAPANSFIEDGYLVLQALAETREDHPYTSAKLTTQHQGDWTYGRIVVRAKLPQGQGIWPAIWMMPSDPGRYGHWPACGEIDIVELLGHQPDTVYGTLHYGRPHTHTGNTARRDDGTSFADDFHEFAIDWAPGSMTWYVDGEAYGTQTNWFTSAEGARWPAPFDQPFYLQLNLAVGGNWPGYPDASTVFPQRMTLDYVRVYRYLGTYPPVENRPAARRIPPAREPTADGNLLHQGDFENRTEDWRFGDQGEARGRFEQGGGRARIQVTSPGVEPWDLQLRQERLKIEQGGVYEILLTARASQPRTVELKVGMAEAPWTSYSNGWIVLLGEETTTHQFSFTMTHPTDRTARVEVNAGGAMGDVIIDSIRLEKVE